MAGIAQGHELRKLGSNPVRVASLMQGRRVPLALATCSFNVGFFEYRFFDRLLPLAHGDINFDTFPQPAAYSCHSTDQGMGRAKHSGAVEVSRSPLDFDRARSEASLQANRAGSDLGGVATFDCGRDFRRNFWPSSKASERWRTLLVVCFLRSDRLDFFLAGITARWEQPRS